MYSDKSLKKESKSETMLGYVKILNDTAIK